MGDPVKAAAIVAAAGRGARIGAATSKVFLPIGGIPILAWSLFALGRCPNVTRTVVVVGEGEEEAARAVARAAAVDCVVVTGALCRAGSVRAGLRAVEEHSSDVVLVHDGARPFASPELIARTIEWALLHGATGPAVPVGDTIKLVDASDRVVETPPRECLRAMQTPQTFRSEIVVEAYRRAGALADTMTDDCEVVAAAGYPVVLCEGELDNRKITHPHDLMWAEAIAARRAKPPYVGSNEKLSAREDRAAANGPRGGG